MSRAGFCRSLAVVAAAVAAAAPCGSRAAPDISGQLRPQWAEQTANARSPLAQADALAPGIAERPGSGPQVETELRASGHGVNAVVTLQAQRLAGEGIKTHAHLNELAASADGAGWQLSAGKKIVAWDVGYGFRPNDVVAQEARRTLLAVTPEGRPLLMAEHFDARTAWALVIVNPTRPRDQRGAEEPALAVRAFRQDGAVDWHGFARFGAHTGASLGAAAAWVASESVELHASARGFARADTLANTAEGRDLRQVDPWQAASVHRGVQALIGGTWTNADQLSLLAEAWWDGTALSDAAWSRWNARNELLDGLAQTQSDTPALMPAVAGNLAWQADAFGASQSLRRANLFARLSWQHDKWQPAIDLLLTPADRGRIVTGSVAWQGDRVRIDSGVRVYGGPSSAVLAQLPVRRVVYLAGTWAF